MRCFGDVPTVSGAIGEAQKRRDGVPDRVPADSVGSIVAHEAIVVAPSRAFFRAVEPEAERNNASRTAALSYDAMSRSKGTEAMAPTRVQLIAAAALAKRRMSGGVSPRRSA